jgi:phosphotransferase family enzyme
VTDLPPWVDAWCRSYLAAAPVELLFGVSHLSEVVGLRLDDGNEVVLKRRADPARRAPRCVAAQLALASAGFPCPAPLTDVVFVEGSAIHAERLVPGGELETEETPAAAARSAVLLADLVRRLAAHELEPPLPNPEWVSWDAPPQRHTGREGPEWLEDTRARVRAKLAACELPRVLGHADWEAQNMRWRDDRPLVVHDWDSLAFLPEAAIVGTAAGVFASHAEPRLAPLRSSAVFIESYERERGSRFTAYESEIAWVASIWVSAHNALDELIYDRPTLSLERLEAEHAERLALANA